MGGLEGVRHFWIHGHDYVLEDDVSIVMDTKELLFEEQAEMMDMAADSKIMIFSPTEKAYKLGDTLAPTQAMTWSQSVLNQLWILMTLLTVPMRMKSFCLYFQSYLDSFVISKRSWMLVWMSCFGPIQVTIALW